jgi:hypothetical protein
MKSLIKLIFVILSLMTVLCLSSAGTAKEPKAKFYDFNEQLIDGVRKQPINLYIDARTKVKFNRLLRLKKSFLPRLFKTAKRKVFK